MTDTYDTIEDDRNVPKAEREWDSAISVAPGSNMRKLLESLLTDADRVDSDLEDIYNAQHINSASDADLEKWGRLVDVNRKTGEDDDKYRARIKAEFRQGTIEPTFDAFAEFCAAVLNTDIENLEFLLNLSGDPATVDIGIDTQVIENSALTATEIQELYGGGVPAGHEVQIFAGGTFRLKSDGELNTAENGLTSDTTDTGGTLAEDVI